MKDHGELLGGIIVENSEETDVAVFIGVIWGHFVGQGGNGMRHGVPTERINGRELDTLGLFCDHA